MDLDLYVRRFHEKALGYYDSVDEEVLVNVCLHGILNEYRLFLKNLSFPSFSRPMRAVRQTNKSVIRTSKPNFVAALVM